MGIRYHAYPVLATDIETARRDPLEYMNNNPIVDNADHDDDSLVLALDKSWSTLQRLFTWTHQIPEAPCLDLVDGDVTYPDGYAEGYLCHYSVLEPAVVARIAAHIWQIDKVDVLALYLSGRRCRPEGGRHDDDRLREDVAYVGYFLEEAKKFVARAAEAGHGIVYRIG